MPAKNGKIIVTGGAGFLGSHVANRLALGRQVEVLDNLSAGTTDNLDPGIMLHVGDVRSEADIRRVLSSGDVDVVVHCAAQTSVARSMAHPDEDWSVNVAGTQRLAHLAAQAGVKRFVFISSGGAIYGDTPEPATELDLPAPRSHYGLHKFAAEQIVRAETPSWAILRPANIYGPRQRTDLEGGVIAVFIERLLSGLPISVHGDGCQRRDFVYVDDVVRAVEVAIDRPGNALWNVASGHSTAVIELLQRLQELTGIDAPLRFLPRRAGDVELSVLSPALLQATGAWGPPVALIEGLSALLAATGFESPAIETGAAVGLTV